MQIQQPVAGLSSSSYFTGLHAHVTHVHHVHIMHMLHVGMYSLPRYGLQLVLLLLMSLNHTHKIISRSSRLCRIIQNYLLYYILLSRTGNAAVEFEQ